MIFNMISILCAFYTFLVKIHGHRGSQGVLGKGKGTWVAWPLLLPCPCQGVRLALCPGVRGGAPRGAKFPVTPKFCAPPRAPGQRGAPGKGKARAEARPPMCPCPCQGPLGCPCGHVFSQEWYRHHITYI